MGLYKTYSPYLKNTKLLKIYTMKKNIFLAMLILIHLSIGAQENSNTDKQSTIKPTKNDFTVGVNFGRGSFISSGMSILDYDRNVSGEASTSTIDVNHNNLTNMIGAEGRYFLTNNIALTLSGGLKFSSTPASVSIPAVIDNVSNATILPAYNSVVSDKRLDVSYSLGALYFFNTKNERLMPYLGVSAAFQHATRTLFDPTVLSDGSVRDLGNRNLEIFGIGAQAVAGVDYYLTNSMYLGFSIKPLTFTSVNNSKYPAPGMYARKINNYTIASFVQPMLSFGFKL